MATFPSLEPPNVTGKKSAEHCILLLRINSGIACLVDDKLAHAHATPDQAAEYARARKKAITAQQDHALAQEEEKTRLMKEKYKDQIEKRQRERLAKREKENLANVQFAAEGIQGVLPAEASNATYNTNPPNNDKAGEALQHIQQQQEVHKDPSHIGYSIVTPTSSDGRAWYRPDPLTTEVDSIQSSLSITTRDSTTRSTFFLLDSTNHFTKSTVSAQEAALNSITKRGQGLMNFGSNWNDGSGISATAGSGDSEMIKLKNARIEVFKDLWKKGYFMGSGLKFGADFLVYPGEFFHSVSTFSLILYQNYDHGDSLTLLSRIVSGDPLRFHSHFVCTVLPSPLSDIAPLDLVAWGRLATAVKKSHLIASWDEKKRKVNYLSLEWAGFG